MKSIFIFAVLIGQLASASCIEVDATVYEAVQMRMVEKGLPIPNVNVIIEKKIRDCQGMCSGRMCMDSNFIGGK
jgi:hypothetical protein